MTVGFLLNRCEFARPKPYNGYGEWTVAIAGCLIWFGAIVVRLGFSHATWTLTEKLVEASSFVVFAGIPIFSLATWQGAEVAQRFLLKRHGLYFQLLVCGLLAIYISIVKQLALNPDRFGWLKQLTNLVISNHFWLNTAIFLVGAFVVLRLPFLLLRFRASRHTLFKPSYRARLSIFQTFFLLVQQNVQLTVLLVLNFIYISLVNTSLISPTFQSEYSGYWIGAGYGVLVLLMGLPIAQQTSSKRLTVFDGLLMVVCIYSLFWFSRPGFSFGVFIPIDVLILVVIYGTGLGREHFGYSFQVRKRDVVYVLQTVAIAALVLVPLALLTRFTGAKTVATTPDLSHGISFLLFFLSYAALFSLRVGLFEEIVFRAGLMVLIRDQLQERTHRSIDSAQLVVLSAAIGSIIFGLCHIGNNPRSGSALSPLEYKLIYAGLATLASFFYAFAFGETNRLWGSIVIHGIVDTTAVVLLGASLTVPF